MSEASFTLEASLFKAIVAAYSAVNSDYFWHFTEEGVKFKAMNPSHISMVAGEIHPNDYRLRGEPFWVRPLSGGSIEQIKTALKGGKKGQIARCEVKGGKMSVGVPPTKFTVAEVAPLEMQETFDPPVPPIREDVRLRFAFNEFRRIVKAATDLKERRTYTASNVYDKIAFNVKDRQGSMVFCNEEKSVVELEPGLGWVLGIEGRGFAAYSIGFFSSLLIPGLSDTLDLAYGEQGVGRLSYEEREYKVYFWFAPQTMEQKDVEKLLEEKPTARTLLFRLADDDQVKKIATLVAAAGSIASGGELSIGLLDDLWVYWSNGGHGYLKVSKSQFQEFHAPESRLSGIFSFKDFVGWFKDVERLECFLETAPEEAMVFVGSGLKTAPKELRSTSLAHTLEVPEVKGTIAFRGPGSTMSNVMDDADAAGDSFLVLVSTPFEISIVGRDRVYYRASLPVDSFQTIEEDHVIVTSIWFRALKDCFGRLGFVGIGKSDGGILLSGDSPIGELRAVLGQWVTGEEYMEAERIYMDEFVKPPAPPVEVKPLPVAPPVLVFGPNEVKVIEQIVENCKYWKSNICKRDTMEKYAKEKGVPDPTAIVEQLIRRGVLYTPKPGYIGLTEPEKYGLPPTGEPYYVPKEEEKPEIVRVAEDALKELEAL